MSEVSTAEPVIDIVGLAKNFGHAHGLSGLDLRGDEGEVHGFLGPNGAGPDDGGAFVPPS